MTNQSAASFVKEPRWFKQVLSDETNSNFWGVPNALSACIRRECDPLVCHWVLVLEAARTVKGNLRVLGLGLNACDRLK